MDWSPGALKNGNVEDTLSEDQQSIDNNHPGMPW